MHKEKSAIHVVIHHLSWLQKVLAFLKADKTQSLLSRDDSINLVIFKFACALFRVVHNCTS